MNLKPLFEKQWQLDQYIIKQKNLKGQDLLPNKILALQVELGELANEWRGFKHSSSNQIPPTVAKLGTCEMCVGTGMYPFNEPEAEHCPMCQGQGEQSYNPLLEEYVDCLHFVLSIGWDLGTQSWNPTISKVAVSFNRDSVVLQFNETFRYISELSIASDPQLIWSRVAANLLGLGFMLGFSFEEIEQAYNKKWEENQQRQSTGY